MDTRRLRTLRLGLHHRSRNEQPLLRTDDQEPEPGGEFGQKYHLKIFAGIKLKEHLPRRAACQSTCRFRQWLATSSRMNHASRSGLAGSEIRWPNLREE